MSKHVVVAKIEQDKLVVTQANRLIEASYSMTIEEKRIVLLMVSLVRQEDRDFHTYRIPITDIRDYLGLHTNKLYDDIKRVADVLMSRVLHIPEEDGGWLKVGWVSSARYVPKGQKGADVACLDLSFSPDMKPYLLELKSHFANYMLQNIAGLRSFYSIRLYELLKSRRRLRSTTFDVVSLRKILKAEAKYANYKDFCARVILTAQSELAGKTDLAFDFTEARRGRKVVGVTFHIRDNVPPTPPRSIIRPAAPPTPTNDTQPLPLPPSKEDAERGRLAADAIAEGRHNGVREGVMRDLLATRDPRHVLENIELARKRHMTAKGKSGGNLPGLTVAAITGDYAADDRAARQARAGREATRGHAKAARAAVEAIAAAATAAWKRDVTARLAALPVAELDALRGAFTAAVEGGRHGELFAADFHARAWRATGSENFFRHFAAGQLGVGTAEDYHRAEAARLGVDWQALRAEAG